MQTITPESLTHLPSRIQYLRDFIDFTADDAAALHAAKSVVLPLIPTLVDAIHNKLLSFDITAKAFLLEQTGHEGQPPVKLEELSLEHPQIKFRQDSLPRYIVKLVSMDYEKDSAWRFLDMIGAVHTGKTGPGHKADEPVLRVEFMHVAILLGYVQDVMMNAVLVHPDLDAETKTAVISALNKILWIQNDLFARHYITDSDVETTKKSGSLS